ncbi:glycosyltransferase family 2 protein [Xanthomarina spongicola]|uniref:Glycosyltransferase involved in cell wall biosynthesis n=1 Tax=Xanthomarina spongicola TaxID=570520 RepID=A0A316DLV4_9FLAO|nr:glycosyltransferase family 2 protein [Xanthomarina spongicola]PWK18209.1 glycosyltransferase involved in cell wall biosynthesis [Xanthomarina spongicola]
MKPFFSIIIPLFNKEAYIKNTLLSVFNQSFKDFEVIIVNDGSTDNSLNIVDTFKDERIKIFSKTNEGVSAARNFGFTKASGKFLTFLDADDIWEETFLEQVFKLINNYPEEHVFATALNIRTEKGSYYATYNNLNLNINEIAVLDYFQYSLDHSILHCASSVFSREVINTIGEFNKTLNTSEDTDYWIRIGLKYPIVFLNKPLATHQVVENGLTKSNRKRFKSIDYSSYKALNQSVYFNEYINKNMFASALKYRLVGDIESFRKLKSDIDFGKLNFKQKWLLKLPLFITKIGVKTYNLLTHKKNYF